MRKEGRTVEGEGNVKEIFDKNSIRVVYMCVCVCVWPQVFPAPNLQSLACVWYMHNGVTVCCLLTHTSTKHLIKFLSSNYYC